MANHIQKCPTCDGTGKINPDHSTQIHLRISAKPDQSELIINGLPLKTRLVITAEDKTTSDETTKEEVTSCL